MQAILKKLCIISLLVVCQQVSTQNFRISGGALVSVQLVLGNQDQKVQLSAHGILTTQFNDLAVESALQVYAAQLFKKHTVKTGGLSYGYDFYSLLGIGNNTNLLGSSFSSNELPLLFNSQGEGGFTGLGFGFQKEYLPNELSIFNVRQGKLLIRSSTANHSINIAFLNDFKFGRLFNGQGSDFGPTGSLAISYSTITSFNTAYRVGAGIELFTPKPDYARTPDNSINSDDGRRNVWHTLSPHSDILYTNLYGFANYTDEIYTIASKLGVNSQKLGAFVQNTLHDSFGLNPRYPWRVSEKDKLVLEVSGSGFYKLVSDD